VFQQQENRVAQRPGKVRHHAVDRNDKAKLADQSCGLRDCTRTAARIAEAAVELRRDRTRLQRDRKTAGRA
jgi:hypothetical protein